MTKKVQLAFKKINNVKGISLLIALTLSINIFVIWLVWLSSRDIMSSLKLLALPMVLLFTLIYLLCLVGFALWVAIGLDVKLAIKRSFLNTTPYTLAVIIVLCVSIIALLGVIILSF